MSHPICAYDCLSILTAEDPCGLQVKCLCTSSTYIAGYHNCINQFCDAADISIWIAEAESSCASAGVIFSSTSGAAATKAPGALSTSVIYQTSVLTAVVGPASTESAQIVSGFPYATTLASSTSTAGTQPVNSNNPASAPISNDSKSGLGVGAIVGIVIGAIALILIALLVAFLILRQRRKQPKELPPETTRVQEVEANNWRPDAEKEIKPITITSVVYTPELSAEQATYATNYEGEPFASEVGGDPRYPYQQMNTPQPDSKYQLSPSSVNIEMAAVVPSEVAASARATSENGPPYHGVIGADSPHQSHITSPVSELGNDPSERQRELSAISYMTSHSPMMGHPMSAAQELSSSPAARPATTVSAAHASAGVGVAPRTDDAEDAELDRMKAEIEAVRAEKERMLQLQALEERERELSRKIVNRELSKGAGE